MKISEVMTSEIKIADPEQTVQQAAQMMMEIDVIAVLRPFNIPAIDYSL